MNHLYIDIETTSGVSMKSAGVYRYAEDEGFRVLLFGYAVDDGPIRIVNLEQGESIPKEVIDALADASVTKIAQDAQFERVCLSRRMGLPRNMFLCSEHWRCLRVWASYCGLPGGMKKIAAVTGVAAASDADIRRVLREKYLADLRKAGGQAAHHPGEMPAALLALGQCLRQNLKAERALHEYLWKHPLPDVEWDYYHMDQRVNDRGVALDKQFVSNAVECDEYFRECFARRFREITGLEDARSPARFRRWLLSNGVRADSVSREAVAKLKKSAPSAVNEALQLWDLLSRTETRKYAVLSESMCRDERMRGLYRFGGHPQGRFSYPLIQLDNLPLCRHPDLSAFRKRVRSGDYIGLDDQCDSVTDVLTQLFTTSFIPRGNCRLVVAKYPALENRILDWLVRDDWESQARSLNFLQDEQPLVSEYFHEDPRVTRLCLDIDNAIRRCLTHPTISQTHGLAFSAYDGTLRVELPSGRALCYREPEIMFGADGFSAILYAGVNREGKWDIQQGNGAKFLRDIVQALARDILLDALRRLSDARYTVVMHLPGKVIVESESPAALMRISAIMEQPPLWGKGLRLDVQGRTHSRHLERRQRPPYR